MDVVPVIDLKEGRAVHAIAGERSAYRPIQHPQVPSGDARALAAFYDHRKPPALYVADLDAIAGAPPQTDLWRQIEGAAACPLWIDWGVRDVASLSPFLNFLQHSPVRHGAVLGTETLSSPAQIETIAAQLPAEQLILSIDRKEGAAIGAAGSEIRLREMLQAAYSAGVGNVIALDLAAVGCGRCADFLPAWRPLLEEFPSFQWRLGGGVRGESDLTAAQQAGFCGVLSATAIFQGAL